VSCSYINQVVLNAAWQHCRAFTQASHQKQDCMALNMQNRSPKKTLPWSTQTLKQLTGSELTFQTQFSTAVRAELKLMCLLCVARVSLYQK